MNNTITKRNLALAAVIMAATLVVGVTLATTTTIATQSALAYLQKKDDNKKDANGNNNGNTITIQKCKQAAIQSGWDNDQEQECENLICTHPGENATCTQEGARAAATPTPTPEPITTTLRVIKIVKCLDTDPECSLPPICDITVTSASTGPTQTFQCKSAIGNGVLVTLQPGAFLVEIHEEASVFKTKLSGDCVGTIAEGQHLTCTITNTEQDE
jgi:hypothetical protein